ncbi:hypothetical protein X466_05890 [Oenococcus oeni S25]|uniref:glycosyltransferase n=10 Tax=Oenococcus oeni TaxID=1247 RepID=UPI00050EAAB4|nr:glycosyltransferase [Oenococcus oeni]KGH55587.1 hypothetical protein X463_06620 [Oenococcus oeni S22]KGH70173.1 hypothetical protein X466_05890 [Oenococcus oeni S25]KGH79924.1 hypothetical protein X281_08005 [Oenococcus oeni IOEB_0607]KGH88673.1 hypothetical protein X296_07870 [Oenococcus oeni IOEB_L26_1]OIK60666.1 hypothetical protein ATW63_07455 [Oenococcus oeni]
MKISVVVAAYNGEEFIKDQLQSIVNQSVRPDEIVITDDGSSDQTLDILHDFSKKISDDIKVRIISNHSEHGFVKNFFNGIFNATGDIIFLSDQDDIWEKNKIEAYLNIYRDHPDAICIHGEIDIVNRNRIKIKNHTQGYRRTEKWDFDHFMKKPNYPGMSLSFKTSKVSFELKKVEMLGRKVRTHDFLIALIAEASDGLYVTNKVYSLRRYTGHNVALQNPKTSFTFRSRISSIDTFIYQYRLSKYIYMLFVPDNNAQKNKILKYISIETKRMLFLRTGKISYLLYIFMHINFLPSWKTIFGDLHIFLAKLSKRDLIG